MNNLIVGPKGIGEGRCAAVCRTLPDRPARDGAVRRPVSYIHFAKESLPIEKYMVLLYEFFH